MSRSPQFSARGTKLASAPPKWIFFAIFTISGFSGLIYESIWSHYLKLFLGHAAYAQSLVLMIFMGGLAIGSWLTARFSDRFRTPILVYAVIEGIIGVIALLFHGGFVAMSDAFYFSFLPALDSPVLAGFLKWSSAAALIVPQSVLLGMTFPLMSSGIIRRYPDQPGASLAMLYFTNSIGAAAGVLASGFWLIGTFGLPGTIMTAGLLNLSLALVVWVIARLDPGPATEPVRPAPAPAAAASADGLAVLFFVASGVTGAASFIYEIGWLRMLSLVLGATTHSFELMLSAFIAGLAFGGLWIKHRIDRVADPIRFAGWVQVLMGVAAVLTVPLYAQTFDWMEALLLGVQRTDVGYQLFTVMSYGIALAVMLPATFLAGMTLPLFTHVLMRGHEGERAIGRVYAANTLGAIAGVLFAVHIGLPLLGLKSLIAFGATLDILLGLALLYHGVKGKAFGPVFRGALVGAASLALVISVVDLDTRKLASGVYRYRPSQLDESTNVVFYKDGKTASISLIERGGQVAIVTNGKPDAAIQMDPRQPSTTDEITMVMAAALPLAYNPQARLAANIGLGSGLTTHALLAHDSLERVDTIEIEAAMVEAARGFGERVSRAFEDRRSDIHVEDAKTFFSLHNSKYDIIVAEPSNPWVSGVASLFSNEFYRSTRNYLNTNGIFVQWLQLYEFNDDLVLSVLKALAENFTDYVIYNTDNVNVLIVAKADGNLGRPSFDRIFNGALAAELRRIRVHSPHDLLARRTATRPMVESLLTQSSVPVNSDYFPFLDLHAGKARFREQVAAMFFGWSVAPLPVLEMIGVSDFAHGNVISDGTFSRNDMISNAYALHAVVTSPERHNDRSSVVSLGSSLTALELLRRSCEMDVHENDWLRGLHTLAELTLSFLDSRTAIDLVDAVLPSACREKSSARLLAWLELYRAVAQRNAAEMAAAAERILTREGLGVGDAARMRYALSAAMLGHLGNGHPEKALAVWERLSELRSTLETTADLELILKLARAGDGKSGGAF